jgi:hypothetical protein
MPSTSTTTTNPYASVISNSIYFMSLFFFFFLIIFYTISLSPVSRSRKGQPIHPLHDNFCAYCGLFLPLWGLLLAGSTHTFTPTTNTLPSKIFLLAFIFLLSLFWISFPSFSPPSQSHALAPAFLFPSRSLVPHASLSCLPPFVLLSS